MDITASQPTLRELSKLAYDSNLSIILAFSTEDAAKYIETLKTFEHKSPDFIREKVDSNNFSKISTALTKIRSINKTDVVTLTSNFKTVKDLFHAKSDELKGLPGFGDEKVKNFLKAFDQKFKSNSESA